MNLAVSLLGLAISIYISIEAAVTFVQAFRIGPDRARIRFAHVILAAMSFLLAGALIKSMLVVDWNSLGMFAAVFALRTLMKLVMQSESSGIQIPS